MPVSHAKFQYRRRSPFSVLLRITTGELMSIDHFAELANETHRSKEAKILRRGAMKKGDHIPDDWVADELALLDDFSALSAEFAIVGLWRCIELYRKTAIAFAASQTAAAKAFRHREFQKELSKLGITEKRVRCARSVDELRCLNNAIKHDQHVDGELADFPRWRSKQGRKLENLESHYRRLRPAAERYLNDLAGRLGRRPMPKSA
jgi:hypothetical protein